MVHRLLTIPEEQSFFLFGARETGKSALVDSILDERSWVVDLRESETYFRYARSPVAFRLEAEQKITHNGVGTIVVDEVLRLPELLNEIDLLLGRHRFRLILTASSTRKLRRGGVNPLEGRLAVCRLFPFVYAETAEGFALDESLRFGSLPAVYGQSESEKIATLNAYVTSYLREEIQEEGIVRNPGGFSRFLDLAAARCGEVVNFSSVGRACRLPTRTVQAYYEVLEDTFLGFRLEPWAHSGRRRLVFHPKFYLFDTGVTNAINRRLTVPPDSATRARLFEQLIVLEVHRKIFYLESEARIFFWRANTGAEVDLLVEKKGALVAAIAITDSTSISGADLSGLRSFRQVHPNVPLTVVCTAPESSLLDGVAIIPWRHFFEPLPELLR
ncbi:MAG TPA: DUF4143 domain-containing protein [Spirochaetia bacterium]|nr:DUF4143 domain-containing protein [Spirochaetia bacterium]